MGAADLSVVKDLAELGLGVPVVSNGNVRTWEDIKLNREETGADGIMVGETLLANPWFVGAPFFLLALMINRIECYSIFENRVPDPVLISLEYLDICKSYPETATISAIRTHVRHFVEFQWYVFSTVLRDLVACLTTSSSRRPWYKKFRACLNNCETVEEIETLLLNKVTNGELRPVPRASDHCPRARR